MASIPLHHSLGDVGHTTDHNSIVDVLSTHDTSISNVQTQVNNLGSVYFSKSGNNVVNVSNPSGYEANVVIPAGSRDSGAYIRTTTYGGRHTFELDSYGQARIGSAIDTTVPLEVYGPSGQTGNLQNWRKGGVLGSVVAYVDANGNFGGPNITPSTWTNIPLAGNITWNFDIPIQYRQVGDMVQLRGNVRRADGQNFNTGTVTIGTLPSGFRPPYLHYAAVGCANSNGNLYVRLEVQPGGGVVFYWNHGAYQPSWVSIDNVAFSRTPG